MGHHVNVMAERSFDPVGDDECLKERKWWCFLLSSIFTFIMGVVSVLVVRALASIFCRKVRVGERAMLRRI